MLLYHNVMVLWTSPSSCHEMAFIQNYRDAQYYCHLDNRILSGCGEPNVIQRNQAVAMPEARYCGFGSSVFLKVIIARSLCSSEEEDYYGFALWS